MNKIGLNRFLLVILLFCFYAVSGQERKLVLTGYTKDLLFYFHPKTKFPGISNDQLYSSIIHNRMNVRWYAGEHLTFGIDSRNRLLFGSMIRDLPFYKSTIDFDPGHFDLAAVVASDKSWFLHTMVDRAWMEFSGNRWQVTIGRQRINWGMNLVWNPNDLFNTFSFFDFDYEERPGRDAIRIRYYTGSTSSAEFAYKLGHTNEENTFAGLYRFTAWEYDFQLLTGKAGPDFVTGAGWSGDILGGGFRGEVSWFRPCSKEPESKEAVIASLSGDYTFMNSLYLHGSFLFNSQGTTGRSEGLSLFDLNLTVKNISKAKYSVFLQASYPITPLFSASASSIINTGDGSFYIGPAATWSLTNNLELLLTGQLFFGDPLTEYGSTGKAAFARLKWAF